MNLGKLIQYYYVTSAIVKWIKSSEKYVFRSTTPLPALYSEQTEQLDRE